MPSTPETSSSESENDEYSTFKRCDVQCLKCYTNWLQNDIYKVVGMPPQTEHDMLSAHTSWCTGKERTGRSHLISCKKVQEMIDFITGHYSSCILKWQDLAEKCNVKTSCYDQGPLVQKLRLQGVGLSSMNTGAMGVWVLYGQQNIKHPSDHDEHWSNRHSDVIWTTEHQVFKWSLWYINRLNFFMKLNMFNSTKKNSCYYTRIIIVLQ